MLVIDLTGVWLQLFFTYFLLSFAMIWGVQFAFDFFSHLFVTIK